MTTSARDVVVIVPYSRTKTPPVGTYRGSFHYPIFFTIPGTFAMTPAAMAVQIISGTI